MATLPWQSNKWSSKDVGKTFVDNNGVRWQSYEDPDSETGYTVKRTDNNGVSFQTINAPLDEGEENRKRKAVEAANADQNTFDRGIKSKNAKTNQYNAKSDRQYKEALVKQAKKDLEFKYYQQAQQFQLGQGQLGLDTLKLGSSLSGPRNWDKYLEAASQAGQNPLLKSAMDSWASLTNVRPNVGATPGPLPQRFDLNALASDYMGQGMATGQNGGVYDPMQNRNAALDTVAMNPGQAGGTGWWAGLSGDEKERAQGYWETRGFSPNSILNSMAYTSSNQGLGYAGA